MSYCSECGAQLNPDENFCHKCGHHVEVESSEEGLPPIPVPTPTTPPPPVPSSQPVVPDQTPAATAGVPPSASTAQKQGGFNISRGCMRIGLIVLAAVVAMGFLIVIAIVSMTSGPVDTLEGHLAALKEGSMDVAFEDTSTAFRSSMNKEQYRQFILNYPVLQNVSDSSFPERSVENNMSRLKGNVIMADGSQFPLAADLIKESGEWKILAIDFSGLPTSSGNQANAQAEGAQPDSGESSVGAISVGAGRDPLGNIINPGSPVPSESKMISANVELINHPAGELVEAWLEYQDPAYKTGITEVSISGVGTGTFSYDIELPGAPSGKWTLNVRLAGEKLFRHEFKIK